MENSGLIRHSIFRALYNFPWYSAALRCSKNTQISITVRYAGGTSSTINLNAFNIVDGSVRVTAAGRQFSRGVD